MGSRGAQLHGGTKIVVNDSRYCELYIPLGASSNAHRAVGFQVEPRVFLEGIVTFGFDAVEYCPASGFGLY